MREGGAGGVREAQVTGTALPYGVVGSLTLVDWVTLNETLKD